MSTMGNSLYFDSYKFRKHILRAIARIFILYVGSPGLLYYLSDERGETRFKLRFL